MITLGLALLAGAAYLLGRRVRSRADHEPRALLLEHQALELPSLPEPAPRCSCRLEDRELLPVFATGTREVVAIYCARCGMRPPLVRPEPTSMPGPGERHPR